jgi:hypothetical protein
VTDSAKDTEAHAVKWDLRHPDFNAPFAHTDAPFLSATPGGAWVAVGYDEFIESGSGDLAQVAWRQPGIVFFKYLHGMRSSGVQRGRAAGPCAASRLRAVAPGRSDVPRQLRHPWLPRATRRLHPWSTVVAGGARSTWMTYTLPMRLPRGVLSV